MGRIILDMESSTVGDQMKDQKQGNWLPGRIDIGDWTRMNALIHLR